MKTILVPAGGGETDGLVFETALAVARPLAAHLEFVHMHVSPGEAARYTPHVDFARGNALRSALHDLKEQADDRAGAAAGHVREFCARAGVPLVATPGPSDTVTARWHEEPGEALPRLIFHARHHDLAVMARARTVDGLPPDRLERMLLDTGRPLLIAAGKPPRAPLGTVMVCWNATPGASRAVSAAMPLLAGAGKVVFVTVREPGRATGAELREMVAEFGWDNVRAEQKIIAPDHRPTAALLAAAARDLDADLMVMGGFGHSHLREKIFGGCTQALLEAGETPLFLMH